jgi:septal ring factor EnvC (AmiA/AmiB activator)
MGKKSTIPHEAITPEIVNPELNNNNFWNYLKQKAIYVPMVIAALSFSSCDSYETASESESKNLSTIEELIDKKEKKIKKLQAEIETLEKDKKDRETR